MIFHSNFIKSFFIIINYNFFNFFLLFTQPSIFEEPFPEVTWFLLKSVTESFILLIDENETPEVADNELGTYVWETILVLVALEKY